MEIRKEMQCDPTLEGKEWKADEEEFVALA